MSNTQDEALKLAIEALEHVSSEYNISYVDALGACRLALSAPQTTEYVPLTDDEQVYLSQKQIDYVSVKMACLIKGWNRPLVSIDEMTNIIKDSLQAFKSKQKVLAKLSAPVNTVSDEPVAVMYKNGFTLKYSATWSTIEKLKDGDHNLYTKPQSADVDELVKALGEIDNWLVCAPIATAEDMAQSFSYMQKLAHEALAKFKGEKNHG